MKGRWLASAESIGLMTLSPRLALWISLVGGPTSRNHLPGVAERRQELELMQRPLRYPILFSAKRASRGDHFHTKKCGSANSGAGKVLGDDEEGRRDGGKALCVGPPTPS